MICSVFATCSPVPSYVHLVVAPWTRQPTFNLEETAACRHCGARGAEQCTDLKKCRGQAESKQTEGPDVSHPAFEHN